MVRTNYLVVMTGTGLKVSRFLNKYTSSTLQLVGFISDLMSKNQNISTKDKIDLFNSGINYKDEIKIFDKTP